MPVVPRAGDPPLTNDQDGERAPALGASRARTLRLAAPLAVLTVMGVAGAAFMPVLLARAPLALVALSPLFRHLVLVAPLVDTLSLYAVGVPRHFLPDPFVYQLGREYGPAAVDWLQVNSPALGRLVRALERLFARVGPVALLVSPDIVVSTLAGVARVRPATFVAMNIAGTFATVSVAKFFGETFEAQIRELTAFFQRNLALVTVASVLLVLGMNALSARGRGSRPPG